MIFTAIASMVVGLINFLVGFLPKVQSLPAGMESAVVFVSSVWHGFLIAFPMFQITWSLLLWYFGIRLSILVFRLVLLGINLLRGSGASV